MKNNEDGREMIEVAKFFRHIKLSIKTKLNGESREQFFGGNNCRVFVKPTSFQVEKSFAVAVHAVF